MAITGETHSERLLFSFGPRQTVGFMLGLRLPQLIAVALGLIVLLASHPSKVDLSNQRAHDPKVGLTALRP